MTVLAAKNVYFVGIKGGGMVALVGLCQKMGKKVWGSDHPDVFYTDAILASMDVSVYQGFSASHIKKTEIDLIVASAAYGCDNEEIIAAKKKGIPILYYPEALGQLFSGSYGIGVVGTHGKTTATSMMGIVMQEAQYSPSVVVGTGVTAFAGRNYLVGSSDFMVAELCEYRRHFLNSKPQAVLLTNIGMDHPDYFRDIYDVRDAFSEFLHSLPDNGILAYAQSDDLDHFVSDLGLPSTVISYGLTSRADVWVNEMNIDNGLWKFSVCRGEREVGYFELPVPGKHNVLNACGVIALSMELGIPLDKIRSGLAQFGGLKRRCEVLGEKDGVLYLDDYGHHPTEIRTTLEGVKDFYPGRKVWCVFQAHTYSRTQDLLEYFGKCFSSADEVLITDIFPSAREDVSEFSVDGEKLAFEIKRHHANVSYTPTFDDAVSYLTSDIGVQSGDLVVCMGAGDAYQVARMILADSEE